MLFSRQWLILYSISKVIGLVGRGQEAFFVFFKVVFALLTSNFVFYGFSGLCGESIDLTVLKLE